MNKEDSLLIDKAKEKFDELGGTYDWISFVNGFMEGSGFKETPDCEALPAIKKCEKTIEKPTAKK